MFPTSFLILFTSSSVSADTFVSSLIPSFDRIDFEVERPIPKIDVSPITTLLFLGRSTPAILAKKFEANRPEMRSSGFKDVDYVLTTRELAIMIRQAGLEFEGLPEEQFDSFMGSSSGAAVIFGSTGGVMEAALRTAYEVVTGREVPFDGLNIHPVRGTEGEVREATIKIENVKPEWSFLEGVELKCAVANGLAHAKRVMQSVKDGTANYHFIEIMACPGGCLGGGGQPIPTNKEIRTKRKAAIYQEDMGMPVRKSHDNPEVAAIYQEFLEKPLGHKSHELLHTHYTPRKRY